MSTHLHARKRAAGIRLRRRLGVIALSAALTLAATPALAIFSNGGFEQNDFSGWTLSGGTNPGLLGS
ncbi:MAG: hypothetical protein WAR01_02340, partial [Dokdonella sp.]|uniref:hypothetical protein n=1 Tax=Dokdonella sp. TaxID=2291710 RepID=UPI003BAF86E3